MLQKGGNKMFGWMGTILRVDLTTGKIEKEPLSEELRHNYLGGRGINDKLLYDNVKRGVDGLAPENALIFGTGPLTGTMIASGRLTITCMSPLTKILGDTNAGSHFSPELKYAGYDHIVFTGKADKPVYLWVENDKVEIRDAQHLWGKLTDETQKMIKEEARDPRIQVTCIGPAGEKQVKLACVIVGSDGGAGKGGIGAVMGSKNLKAIAVRGTKGVKVAQPEVFRKLANSMVQRMMRNPNYQAFSTQGSPSFFRGRQITQTTAIRNATKTGAWDGYDALKGETLYEKYVVKKKACMGCANHCRSFIEIKDGPFSGLKGVGFEFATQSGWGALCDISNAPAVYQAFILCNQYGLDQSECNQEIAAAMEWYEKGLITKEDLQGVDLKWGNYEGVIEMIHKIAKREGIGDVLAEGGVKAAEKIGKGAEKCISHSKGQLRTTGDLRTTTAYMLGEATSTRGADHLRGSVPFSRVGPGQYKGAAKEVYEMQFLLTIADALEVCKFNTLYTGMEINLKDMTEFFSAATGREVNEDTMREIADRIWNLERAFIVREGITRKDDVFVGRYMDEPVHGGSCDGLKIDRTKWDEMLDDYYDLNGWDKKTGIPTRTRLETLGLKDVADELEAI
jgi:aldehyde:ferredoxin oxidoreductase